MGGDLSRPLPKPIAKSTGAHGIARSDAFITPAFGSRWTFYGASPDEAARAVVSKGGLVLKGTGPRDSSPLSQMVGDQAYKISVRMELMGDVTGGLLLFYKDRLFFGMGHDGTRMRTYRGGKEGHWQEPTPATQNIFLKIVNDHHIVTFFYSEDGRDWTRHGSRIETSGCHTNVLDDLASLRPALFAAGEGSVRFEDFRYKAL
ncbi:hypothetical protein [Sphingobium lactosutens]|uniref:beta-xylosidase family glycoside hydrolase n=1 Tax=Sphingobium lactosutens TaxID=522773 RepID=UPI00277B4F80|nr:hypothetical protein [Sphingobium lactosutens]